MREHDTMFDAEIPEQCVECGEALAEDNDTGFCCEGHAIEWDARQRAADEAYVRALMDEARLSAEWKAEKERARRESRGLPEAPGQEEIPERLRPSTGVGMMMVAHFKDTPRWERV